MGPPLTAGPHDPTAFPSYLQGEVSEDHLRDALEAAAEFLDTRPWSTLTGDQSAILLTLKGTGERRIALIGPEYVTLVEDTDAVISFVKLDHHPGVDVTSLWGRFLHGDKLSAALGEELVRLGWRNRSACPHWLSVQAAHGFDPAALQQLGIDTVGAVPTLVELRLIEAAMRSAVAVAADHAAQGALADYASLELTREGASGSLGWTAESWELSLA